MSQENKTPVDSSQLINYAYGLLAPHDAERVRLALEQDEELRWEYEGIVQLMEDHPGEDPEDMLDGMADNVENKLHLLRDKDKKKSSRIPLFRKPFVIAASVIVVIGIGFLINFTNDRNDPVLIARELVKREYSDEERRERGKPDTTWVSDFDGGNYLAVIQKLALLPDSILRSKEEFFFGLSYLKIDPQQLDKAEMHLRKSTLLQGEYQQDAWFYLGIVQLLKGNIAEAKKCLSKANSEQANELLGRLPK